ncbi:sigma-70 family RNA polymerase sigma factor [Micromonospora echinofusca]|uniref:RNA polymerase sigma factor n=1 Tax=Micromonospora echinofusca TaxID=47858 RepID=A0ABS3W0U2_MICEH|nr:sigma-70 family RNA polymerase sigma factor [Micromonospora echinofusca]MBO4210412.1 sigma-70 family RNA polymerase sigma factor [Micromonospora echinofusca]
MSDDTEITRWALAAGRGDRDAASRFVRATQSQVWRFVGALIGPADADDLTQETYLRAMRSLPSFAARSSALTWLLGIARHVAVDHLRAIAVRPRTVPLSDRHDLPDVQRSGFDGTVALEQLLRGIEPDRRVAFVATQVVGLSYAEAAEVCGCAVGTIRSRVARAREDLVAAVNGQARPRGRFAG